MVRRIKGRVMEVSKVRRITCYNKSDKLTGK